MQMPCAGLAPTVVLGVSGEPGSGCSTGAQPGGTEGQILALGAARMWPEMML